MLELEKLPGNGPIKEQLKELLTLKEWPSPILFGGPKGVGQELFAERFAHALLLKKLSKESLKLNMRRFSPVGKAMAYSVEEVKQVIEAILAPPFEADHKVVLLKEVEKMSKISAHALLKTLEEPPAYSTILLTSSESSLLLPTLVSRCFELHFCPISDQELSDYLKQEHGKSEEEARRISLLAHGRLSRAEALASDQERPFFDLIAALGCALIAKDRLALEELLIRLEALIASEPIESRIERRDEACFACFYWYRDLELLALKGDQAPLFFSDHKEKLKKCLTLQRPSFEEVGKKMERIQRALELNVKLSHALDLLL